MPTTNTSNKKNNGLPVILFITGLIAGILITFFLKSFFNKTEPVSNSNNLLNLSRQSDSLQSKFNTILFLNKKYASLISNKNIDSIQLQNLDSLNILITHNQLVFLENLDSLQISNSNVYDRSSYGLLQRITNSYRSALEESDAINSIRNSFNIGNTNYSFDQNIMNDIQNKLKEKDAQIADLSLKLSAYKNFAQTSSPANYSKLIKQQDSVINVLLLAQKKKNENLIDYNTKLKFENDKLTNELKTLNNSTAQNQVLTSSMVSKQNLNEQLSLAQVDCYLSRADARQIVSNSKQRKDLLENALKILKTLSQSNNASVKEAVQAKLTELKTIASNNHD